MIITNVGADYSGTGLGKVPYVSAEINQLLSVYPSITNIKKQAFQAFIDNIGGLNGTIWGKVNYLFCPILSANLAECFIDLKGHENPIPTLTIAERDNNYSFVSGKLSQNSVVMSSGDELIGDATIPVYRISGFGIVDRNTSYSSSNFITRVGGGNISKTPDGNGFYIQKHDGTNNQDKSVAGLSNRPVHAYTYSGLAGIDAESQNILIVDGVEGLQTIKPSFNLSYTSNIGSLGTFVSSTTPTHKLQDASMLGFGLDFTREESRIVNTALLTFADSVI